LQYNIYVSIYLKNLFTRIAIFAMLLHAFAPVASQAMMAKSGMSFIKICTAQGFKLVEAEIPGSSNENAPGIKVGHECAICALTSAPPCPAGNIVFSPAPFTSGHVLRLSASTFAFVSALQFQPPSTGPPAL
jgi:hypothetical protein